MHAEHADGPARSQTVRYTLALQADLANFSKILLLRGGSDTLPLAACISVHLIQSASKTSFAVLPAVGCR
jgi:hypothetical protein